MGKKQRQKTVLPPELPPEVHDDDVEVSDEDMQFLHENRDYAGFVSNLDTKSITKHVSRVANAKEDALETMYERRLQKRAVREEKEENQIEVDPVDALPVKTLDGKLYFKTVPKASQKPDVESETEDKADGDMGLVKMTKAEKRAKKKKLRKEAKKQGTDVAQGEEVLQVPAPQAEVLDEVKKELNDEEANEKRKLKLAELGTALLVDPDSNIKNLREMLDITRDGDHYVVILGLKSLLAVFRDIIPGYRIRLPTEKEQEMKVSKVVKKTRFVESTLLSAYKAYVQKLIALEQQAIYTRDAMRCICTLLEAVPHFNFRENLLASVIKGIGSEDDVVRKLCCAAVKSLFLNEGKHGGEVTVEAVQMIAELVKAHDCHLHPDSVEVFMSLSFDDDLGRPESSEVDKSKYKNSQKKRKFEEPNKKPANENKKSRQESISKTREEVKTDYKAASLSQDARVRRRMQTETLSAVFQTFFRILKHTVQPRSPDSRGGHPLLAPCLNGIGKFAHLIDLDFMADLMSYLRKLAGTGSSSDENAAQCLTVSERLQCCIVAFKVMKNNLDALNVDLQEFFVQLYGLILEYRPGRDKGDVLAEALKIMLCDGRQHDMQRAAAFIKRLSTFSLCFGSAEALAALVTVKQLLQKNVKCRNLLENDAGGGSVSGLIAKYHPYASDPNLSGALAAVLWELNLLAKHYHPSISTTATSIATMNTDSNQAIHAYMSPQQAYRQLSAEQEASVPSNNVVKLSGGKRKKGSISSSSSLVSELETCDENQVKEKLKEQFLALDEMVENERLRSELGRTMKYVKLYEEYKNQKRKKKKVISKKV